MINLLPPQQKQKLHQHRVKRLMIVLGFIGTVFLIALGLVLFALNLYLGGQIRYQNSILEAKREEGETAEIESIQNEFADYNGRLSKLESFYQSQRNPSELIEELQGILPNRVYLTDLSYQKLPQEEYQAQVSISGYSPSREVLFQLRENLISKTDWKKVNFPRSSWVKPADINFEVSFKIDEDKE